MDSGQYLRRIMAATAFALCAGGSLPVETRATEPVMSPDLAAVMKYGFGDRLAYVQSKSPQVNNSTIAAGVQALRNAIKDKTSIDLKPEPDETDAPPGVIALDPEKDSFMPYLVIYWPVTKQDKPLSEKAKDKVQDCINHGGLLMFDLMDVGTTDIVSTLHNLLGVNLGLLQPMPDDHTLTFSFYKVTNAPGSWNNERVLTQAPSSRPEDVTKVIVGRRNWAQAWAGQTVDPDTDDGMNVVMAAVNAVIYAYTGDYKRDQAKVDATVKKVEGRAP